MVDDDDVVRSNVPPGPVAGEPSFRRALRGALWAPRGLFLDTRALTALGAPLRFAAGIGLLSGALASSVVVGFAALFTVLLQGSELFPAKGLADGAYVRLAKDLAVYLVGYPLVAVAGALARGGVVQAVAVLSGGRGSYARAVRVAAYASAPMALVAFFSVGASLTIWRGASWVAGVVAAAWGSWVVAEGVTVLHGARSARAYPVALASLLGAWVVEARILAQLFHAVRAALRHA